MPAPKQDKEMDDPRAHLPLTPLAFHILLALGQEPLHGYAIIQDIEARTEGAMKLRSGTLYNAIRRLEADGLLAPSERRPAPDRDDQRRNYFRLTELGREVAHLESKRMASLLTTAQSRQLFQPGEVKS
ncbi:MAG TPA: PadR family transcriptional regulator [Acidobacteriota bacterium]|nr:PadR family transcriptional regulator [Acidobacteriota bacterium]